MFCIPSPACRSGKAEMCREELARCCQSVLDRAPHLPVHSGGGESFGMSDVGECRPVWPNG